MNTLCRVSTLFTALAITISNYSMSDDECQPWIVNEKRNIISGQIICRYTLTSPDEVNSNTCTELANKYEITIEKFFFYNPDLDRDCKNIEPNTEYCVAGFIDQLLAKNGLCGPPHNNATCKGTRKQCCNSETWTCGDTFDDCREGTCYEGSCHGADEYAIDGKCGRQHGGLKCGGKWGSCCNNDGVCGNGSGFCGLGKCQSGLCEKRWLDGHSPDGTCGGNKNYVCNPVFGYCCGRAGQCGMEEEHCGEGCQEEFVKCD
ncbi:hypothetical protein CC86DRAFT_459542 [Ophiobolus disseminans]|uniref:Chitin-binding type-1 domain-containing protein n=1 Tax=Ophiobolus disseminans TaxID=1469910 RepID=A0A6A6ZHN4_9PLEO|nr:hypothetical protein CC86DRAFT_459542 [Ophiobolus disseminans]